MPESKKAVILLSGGLDSATCLAIAQSQGYDCHAISFRYGQRHAIELTMAAEQAQLQHATEHKVVELDLRAFGGSALTADIDVPKHDVVDDIGEAIPITYVPARNTIFLSYALAYAEVIGAYDIFIGVNALDYSGYPDCRPDFIEAYETMANLAIAATTSHGTKSESGGEPFSEKNESEATQSEGQETRTEHQRLIIHTPLIDLTKAAIIAKGQALGVDYGKTISCYDPDPSGKACGRCDSCLLREKGFSETGSSDPA